MRMGPQSFDGISIEYHVIWWNLVAYVVDYWVRASEEDLRHSLLVLEGHCGGFLWLERQAGRPRCPNGR
jgi:hypothetical protein